MKINKSLIYLIIAAVIWGATVPIMKITLREIPIFSLIVLRMTVASILLLPFAYKHLMQVKKEDFSLLFLAAFFGTNLNLALFFYGLEHSQAINGSVILATTPIFTLIFAHIYLREKWSIKLVSGTILAFLGVLTIIGIPVFELDFKSTLGNLALIASSLAWVGHEIFSKKALKHHHFTVVVFYTTAIGAIVFMPLALMELFTKPNWYSNISTQGLLGLLYGIIFASFLGYTSWQKGLATTTATLASFVFYLLPITGIIFSIILLHESFSPLLIIGTLLVLAGVVLAEFHRKTHPIDINHHK